MKWSAAAAVAALLVCGACTDDEPPTAAAEVARAHKLATEAEALGNQWTTVPKLLQEARQALTRGDEAQARSLAAEAASQAELAIKQAHHEAAHWREGLPPP